VPFIGVGSRTGHDKQDAQKVGQAILDLVERLGLKTNLNEYKVGKDQLPVITKTATRQESGPVYDAVMRLVQGLW